ncbi:MAG TPA: RNA polymerase subunit sigma-24 [Treponema sp.]|nr:RNA polymerase subunit sigma-24 [Treponema sp.]
MANELLSGIERSVIEKRDSHLVKSTLKGDKNAFAQLMSFHKQRIFALGMSFFKNDADADDFVQDVFIKAYTHLASFKGNSLFSTWLMRIAYNTAINAVNRRKEYLPLSDEEIIVSTDCSPEEHQMRQAAKDAVRDAMKELPEKYAVCLDMYFSYDIPYQEICEITGFPVNTIKSHIFRAKKILRKKLEEIVK